MIGKKPQTFSEAVDAARIAELSVTDTPSSVTEQQADIKSEMQRLTKQYDASMKLTAAFKNHYRDPSRKVIFEDDARLVRRISRQTIQKSEPRPPTSLATISRQATLPRNRQEGRGRRSAW